MQVKDLPHPPQGAEGRARTVLLVAAALAVAGVVVVAAVALGGGGKRGAAGRPGGAAGGRLQSPAQVGGLARIDDPDFAEQAGTQAQALTEDGFTDFVVAGYGNSAEQPDFVLVAVRAGAQGDRQRILDGINAGLESSGVRIGQTGGTLVEQDGTQFRCSAPDPSPAAATCLWEDDQTVGVGYSTTMATRQLSELTAEARRDLRG